MGQNNQDQPKKDFKLPADYNTVASRIQEFRTRYPEGSLQQVSLSFQSFGNAHYVVYTAAAYRTPDDKCPGMGTALEPIPGRTPYTKDSEVQNAETAAWGRAIIAAGAADAKKGIASAEEIAPRQAEREERERPEGTESKRLRAAANSARQALDEAQLREVWAEVSLCEGDGSITGHEYTQLRKLINILKDEITRTRARVEAA